MDDDPQIPLKSALADATTYWKHQFDSARNAANALPANAPPSDAAKAQAQLLSALQQLAQVQSMLSDQRNRDGLDAAVTLMRRTTTLADTVYDQLTSLVTIAGPSAAELQRLDKLTALLEVLARLAPTPIFGKSSPAK